MAALPTSDDALLIESRGEGWRVTLDLRSLPAYWTVRTAGKTSRARVEQLHHMIRTHWPRLINERGSFYPLLLDVRDEGTPSMEGLHAGLALVRELGRYTDQVACWLPEGREKGMMGYFLSIIEQASGLRFQLVSSLAEVEARWGRPMAPSEEER